MNKETGTAMISGGSSERTATPLATESSGNTDRVLKSSAIFWFLTAMFGQWLFFYYIIAFYGLSVANGNLEIWNRFEPLGATPYVVGDWGGNMAFAMHALGAGIVAFGGALQLIPQLRRRAPAFHHWNGRVYLFTVIGLSLSGFYLVWIRGTSPSLLSGISSTINGLLILGFSFFALRSALRRQLGVHRRWAMRLYLVSNAQWFLRVGVFSYMIIGTLLGLQPGFNDPFFLFWTFACYLLPLGALQLYFYASDYGGSTVRLMTSALLVTLAVLMIFGMVGLTPFLQKLISGDPFSF